MLTPYKAQVRKLRSAFAKSVAPAQLATVEFATVDGFQARAALRRCPPVGAVRHVVCATTRLSRLMTGPDHCLKTYDRLSCEAAWRWCMQLAFTLCSQR